MNATRLTVHIRAPAIHEALPPGLSPEDNETGWRMALEKLAKLVES